MNNNFSEAFRKYNVIWTTQSTASKESMPVGGYNCGYNVWVENNEILLYLSQGGTFDENNTMLKLGRVRVSINPNPFETSFKQELKLYEGYIQITGTSNSTGLEVQVNIWADTQNPVGNIEVVTNKPIEIKVSYENWRTAKRLVEGEELRQCSDYNASIVEGKKCPYMVYTYTDTIIPGQNKVMFYHRNKEDVLVFDRLIKLQKVENIKAHFPDLQKNRTFGGIIFGDGLKLNSIHEGVYSDIPFTGYVLKTGEDVTYQKILVAMHTAQAETIEVWQKELDTIINKHNSNLTAFEDTKKWWEQYWNKSYIFIDNEYPDSSNINWQIGRNYQLFRYMLGCNYYGKWPTKFNGGLFTFDAGFTPDYRAWGGGTHTTQNQRLVYWPMLKSGDYDAMLPQFEYFKRITKARIEFSKFFWNHEGACFPEQLDNFGLYSAQEYAWSNRTEGLEDTVEDLPWTRYEFSNALEMALMILDYYKYSDKDITEFMQFIESVVIFYDRHYKTDENGKYNIYPSTALESYKGENPWGVYQNGATNPTDVISGLAAVLNALLSLPENYTDFNKAKQWREMLMKLPPIPFGERNGKQVIKPAEKYGTVFNCELPQLYPLYPYRIYGLWSNKYELDRAVNTYISYHEAPDHPDQLLYTSWHQNGIFAAKLGLTDFAYDYLVKKMSDNDSGYRFPAFWGPGHDWMPDHNWGGSGAINLQEMLLQTHDNTIYLLPAFPKNVDVNFKLWIEDNTFVECSYINGNISYNITPRNKESKAQYVVKIAENLY